MLSAAGKLAEHGSIPLPEECSEMTDNPAFNEENIRLEIEKIRPLLQNDGGDIEFVGLEGAVVRVRLKGSCSGCAFASLTLQYSVERTLRQTFPELERVENVTQS
jgi:Fe-S cluster biogenesis protein NfuA